MALFFDWYEATLEGTGQFVIDQLCRGLGVTVLATSKGMHGYDHSTRLGTSQDGDRVADVWTYDDPKKAHLIHVVSSGVHSTRVSNLLRELWPVHKVSRLDVAFDMLIEGGYEQVSSFALSKAQDLGIGYAPCIEDRLSVTAGRTQYLGSPRSSRMALVYEKGKQLRALGKDVDVKWVRVELRTRPQSKHKQRYASLSPGDVAAESPLMASLCERFGPKAGTRQAYSTGHTNSTIEACGYMLRQYGRALRDLISNHCGGDPHHFGVILASVLSTGGGSAELSALLAGSHYAKIAAPELTEPAYAYNEATAVHDPRTAN